MSSTRDFPRPVIPPSPLLNFRTRRATGNTVFTSVLDIKNALFTTSGRASIALAFEHAKIGVGDEVLIPAYHCEAMVAPARWCAAQVVFYRIHPDTSIQIDDIAKKITDKTKAIIVTHYFGFEQRLTEIRALCTKHSIVLIEDCAHALFGISSGKPIGTTGDYAIASCLKFLPIYEGGLICSSLRDISAVKLFPASRAFQVKSAINCLEASAYYNRPAFLGRVIKKAFQVKDKVWTGLKNLKANPKRVRLGPSSSEGGFGLDEDWIHIGISRFSLWIVRNADLNGIADKRRQNYLTLYEALSSLPGCRPLFSALSVHTVPWVFPLYVDRPENYFFALKMAGIPVWRFGEFLDVAVTSEVCPVSVDYSKHILQFPCHQSLSEQEMAWMIDKIVNIFSE